MWRIGARIVGFLLAAWILIEVMQELGANVVPLLAGLGVGGLAVAIAARETLTDEELRQISERFASASAAARPRGLGIFVPPHEEGSQRP